MFSGLLLVLLSVVVVVVVVSRAVGHRRTLIALDEAAHPGLRLLRRASLVSRAVSGVVGLAAVVVAVSLDGLGRGAAVAPAVFGAVQLLGVLGADLLTRDAVRTRGRAGLESRSLRDLLPSRRLTTTLAGTAGVLGVGLVWTSSIASSDDGGRAGRSIAYACRDQQVCTTGAHGPWPGSFYAVPMAVTLVVLALLAAASLVVIVRRPRDGSDPDVVRLDDVIRRRSVESVVSSLGIALGGTLAGVAAAVAVALALNGRAPLLLQLSGWVALVVGVAAVGVVAWCLVVLALPGAGAPARLASSRSSRQASAHPA